MKSTFPLTVTQSLYDATCQETDQFFADVVLYGAGLNGGNLTFRTRTAWRMARADSRFVAMAAGMNIKLVEPSAFPGDGDRPTSKAARDRMANDY